MLYLDVNFTAFIGQGWTVPLKDLLDGLKASLKLINLVNIPLTLTLSVFLFTGTTN